MATFSKICSKFTHSFLGVLVVGEAPPVPIVTNRCVPAQITKYSCATLRVKWSVHPQNYVAEGGVMRRCKIEEAGTRSLITCLGYFILSEIR
jgi:hypothetical protein